MVAFYRDVLGFTIDWDETSPFAEFHHEGVRFAMYPRTRLKDWLGTAPTYPSGLNGSFSLAFDVPRFLDVDEKFLELVSGGATMVRSPYDASWGQRTAVVADPDGNLIEIASWGTE